MMFTVMPGARWRWERSFTQWFLFSWWWASFAALVAGARCPGANYRAVFHFAASRRSSRTPLAALADVDLVPPLLDHHDQGTVDG